MEAAFCKCQQDERVIPLNLSSEDEEGGRDVSVNWMRGESEKKVYNPQPTFILPKQRDSAFVCWGRTDKVIWLWLGECWF
mmetsp:Transcript_14007/g.38378  ORF Transcript_14007/g.38378 Transcript_14007/m.38378 type:complete len:80 (-) Transcript_14007:94-333(-)